MYTGYRIAIAEFEGKRFGVTLHYSEKLEMWYQTSYVVSKGATTMIGMTPFDDEAAAMKDANVELNVALNDWVKIKESEIKTEQEFVADLTQVLSRYTDTVRVKITRLLSNLPDQAIHLNFEVFASQDADGFFTIRANLDGPNLYVFNQAIASYAALFDTHYAETGIEPTIPLVDPFDVDYPVNDIIVDCTANWLKDVWQSLVDMKCTIPVMIIGHDDYGTVTPIEIHTGAV